nr:MAG TPA: hypothetical protein [Caudoviricetes sp.]
MHYDDLPRFAKLNAIKQVPAGYSVYDYRYTEEGLIMTCIRDKRHETALLQLEQSIREYKKSRESSHINDIVEFARLLEKTR